MTGLQIFDTLEQGSDEWLQARCGILTASVIGKLLTPTLKPANNETARSVIATLVAERLTGRVDYIHPSADMNRGTMDEPIVRNLYSEHYAPVTEVGFMLLNVGTYQLGYSPDGLVEDNGLIEVKSRRPKTQIATILTDEVPAENMAQLMCGLYVSGRDWIDYLSYAGGLPLYRKRIEPDPNWVEAIQAALEHFEAAATEMTERFQTTTHGFIETEYIDHFQEIEIA